MPLWKIARINPERVQTLAPRPVLTTYEAYSQRDLKE